MAHEIDTKKTDEGQTVVRQEQPLAKEVPPLVSGAKVSRKEATPGAVGTAAVPPPPSGRLAGSIQRMPPAGRWALGFALAFLSNFAYMLFSGFIGRVLDYPTTSVIALVVMFGLALTAGYVLSSWWALLALAITTVVGGFVGVLVFVQMTSGVAIDGPTLFGFLGFVPLLLGPLILLLLAGVGFGKLQGIALGQPHVLSAGEARVSRWIVALGPVLAAGQLAALVGYVSSAYVVFTIPPIFYAIVPATTCLLAGWLLRSWWGLVVAPVLYVGAVALMLVLFIGIAGQLPIEFAWYVVLPAVVMSAIGTAIGMYRAR